MTTDLAAVIIASAPFAAGALFCFYIGRFTWRRDGENRGLRIGSDGQRVIADMVARRWINRTFQPLAHYKNKQHWMELARRECHQLLADDLCKAFNIETPKRTVENG